MIEWVFLRVLQALAIVLVMTVIVFAGIYAIGDPIELLVTPDANQAEREAAARALGLDRPLVSQYLTFLREAVTGNFGKSYVYGVQAVEVILQRMPATFELAFLAVALSVVIGLPLGLYAGLYPERRSSRLIMAGSILGFSLPTFWVGIMLILVFSVVMGWLPSSGRGSTVQVLGIEWSIFTLDGLRHLFLPALNLSLTNISMVLRLTRAGVREAMAADYIKFARAKGLSPKRIVGVHVLRNILIPIVTVVGLDFGNTVAFAVVTENIFAWPGMGKLLIDSIGVLDRPVIIAYLIVIVVLFVTVNLIVDIVYTRLDPRVRLWTKS